VLEGLHVGPDKVNPVMESTFDPLKLHKRLGWGAELI
jgi:hypothetical protein